MYIQNFFLPHLTEMPTKRGNRKKRVKEFEFYAGNVSNV